MSTTGENNKGAAAGVQGSPPKKAVAESSGGGSSTSVSAPDSTCTAHADATVAVDTTTAKIDPITALQDDIGMYFMYQVQVYKMESCHAVHQSTAVTSRGRVDESVQRSIRIHWHSVYGSHLIWNYSLTSVVVFSHHLLNLSFLSRLSNRRPYILYTICQFHHLHSCLNCNSDGLSLAMFEGLRGLRDAVAPESGNLAGEGNPAAAAAGTDENNSTHGNGSSNGSGNSESSKPATPDMDELYLAYQRGDPSTVRMMQSIVSSANTTNTITSTNSTATPSTTKSAASSSTQKVSLPKNAEDFARLYNTKMEVETDTLLVTKLAGTVLAKSRQIDKRVDDYLTPVRTRTRDQQMARIQELLTLNQEVTVELEAAHLQAKARRDVCRRFIRDQTCAALGIEQIND
jgi:hypothetical protein